MKRIAIIQFSSNLDGSSFSGLMLADGLREAGWDTFVSFAHDGPIIQKFQDSGHQVQIVPHKNWLRARRLHRFLKNRRQETASSHGFESYLSSIKPDIVYINTAVSYAGALAAKKLGLKVIWHIRELSDAVGGEMRIPSIFRKKIQQIFASWPDKVVVNSKAVAENMLGSNSRLAEIVPNAVGQHFFDSSCPPSSARWQFQLPEDKFVIGIPGTLRPMKGHPFFFEALSKLKENTPEIIAAVTGGGSKDYKTKLEAQVQRLGIQDIVRFIGYTDEMPAFYKACSLVCIPSVAEPFGRTVIEAFAAGTPVVASAVGGIKETVSDGETGILVPYGDVGRLAAVLEDLIRNSHLREKLSLNAKQEAEEKYRATHYKARLCNVVRDVFEKQP